MGYQEPEFMPWDGRRVPVTLLGGYLGAGKTTVINEILRSTDRPIAVLVNDVGSVNIDSKLLRRRNRTTIEFTDGCVCCSLSDGLGSAFDQLRANPTPPDHVVLELSGVAEPSRVVPWTASAGFDLDGVVVLIDAEQFPTLEAHDVIGHTVRNQVLAADLLVLTKLDLATPESLATTRRRLNQLRPDTPVIEANQASAGAVLSLGARRPASEPLPAPTLFDIHQTSVVPLPWPATRELLDAIVDQLPADTLRAKGIAETLDGDQLIIQVVGRRRSISPLLTAERTEPTDLVVIRPSSPEPTHPGQSALS